MTSSIDFQRLSDVYDAQRQIIVMHRPLNPKSKFETPEDKPYPVTELAADITPYALAELIAENILECNRDDITAIFQIEDDGRSITNIMKPVFAEAWRIEFQSRRECRQSALSQLTLDNERHKRAMEAI